MLYFEKGFNYSQDGRGNRLVFHLQGCNLRCPWCSNPEGIPAENGKARSMAAGEILSEALRSMPMFFDGGGVTFTGGEATRQFDELSEALRALKSAGIHTAVETNGTHENLPSLFPDVGELIMDFKHYDSAVHRRRTGAGNEAVVRNLAAAMERHPDLLVRIPLIRGFNASLEDIRRFADFFLKHPRGNTRVELLAYHEYGKAKWARLGMEYTVADAFVPPEAVGEYEAYLHHQGLQTVRT